MTPFVPYVIRRFIGALLFVFVVAFGTLVLGSFVPGDATTQMFLSGAGRRAVAQERARLGLDQSRASQVGKWVLDVAHFDLGTSSLYGQPVGALVRERAINTAELATVSLVLAVGIGLPLGVLTGGRPRGALATLVTPVSVALVSCPPIIGAIGLLLVGIRTGWFSVAPGTLTVPALALGLPFAAVIERVQSRATIDAFQSPAILAAAARGIPRSRLLWIHAARQSLGPVLGIFGVIIGALFGGSLAVEYIAAWPGLGRLMYDALVGRDMSLVAGCALLGAVFLAAGNFLADLARGLLDPRVRR